MARTLTYSNVFKLGVAVGLGAASRRVYNNSLQPEEQVIAEAGRTSVANTVNIRQPALHENHPLASLFGKYANEPLWDDFEEALRKNRERDSAHHALD